MERFVRRVVEVEVRFWIAGFLRRVVICSGLFDKTG